MPRGFLAGDLPSPFSRKDERDEERESLAAIRAACRELAETLARAADTTDELFR